MRLLVQGAALVAFVAMTLQYYGLAPQLLGFNIVPWLPSHQRGNDSNVNVAKLLADLNADRIAEDGSNNHAEGIEPLKRAASAALSVVYLSSLPGLKDQVKQAPGILASLLRHTLHTDLQAVQRALQHRRELHGQQVELVAACLLAIARMATGDGPLQAWLLGAADADTDAGAAPRGPASGGGERLPAEKLLTRLEELLGSGVPAWQAASAVLLHALAGEQLERPEVVAWVADRAAGLVDVAVGLVEAGANYNSTDVAIAGMQLMELVAARPEGRQRLAASQAPGVAAQVVVTRAGDNSSSLMVGGAARMLRLLTAGEEPGQGQGGGSRPAAVDDVARDLVRRGLIPSLVREVRMANRASMGPTLGLLADLVLSGGRGDHPRGQQQGQQGKGSSGEGAVNEALAVGVGSGILSLCTQLLFKEGTDEEARLHCSTMIRSVASEPEGENAAETRKQETARVGSRRGQAAALQAYADSEQGRAVLAADLLRIMRSTPHPDLHNAVLEALRDVAPSRAAAEALAAAGAVGHLALILSTNVTQEKEQGADSADIAWLLQSQRSAAAVVALLALQGGLRGRLVEEGAVQALAAALECGAGQPGLVAQVRVTAAAALVPLLGTDGRYNHIAVAAGAVEPLLAMTLRGNPQEQQAASRVLKVLGR